MKEPHYNKQIEQQAEYYSKVYIKYTQNVLYKLDRARIEKVYNIITSNPPGRVLDIGCLQGSFLLRLKEKGWECYGIELSKIACFEAQKKGLNVICCNVECGIPFKDSTFDVVYAGEIIEHIYDTDYFLQEIRRVLKRDGIAVITTPNIACLINRILLLFGKYPRYLEYNKHGAGHIHLYNRKVLEEQLKSNRFKILKVVGNFLSIPDPTPDKILRNTIFKKLGDYFPNLSENLIFVVKPLK